MESIQIELNRTDANINDITIFKAKLKRHGDLVQQVYFVFELPDIVTNNADFAWVNNIGEAAIDNYHINIGGVLADRQYGEFLHVSNLLSQPSAKYNVYRKLIGDVPSLTNPKSTTANGQYPPATPAIPSRKIYVPLNFWFNKDSGSSLPLLCLQYSETEITIEMRPLAQLYKVYGRQPRATQLESLPVFVHNGNRRFMINNSTVNIRAYLEVNYYFVDVKEREAIAYNSHEYLIEQTTRIERFGLSSTNIFDLVLQNPVKEFIWVIRRNDVPASFFEFTDNGASIMQSAKFVFNGIDRIDEKDWMYFNHMQTYQHHNGAGKDGLYIYSFSMTPDDISQPSGSCNMSRINKIQFMLTCMNPILSSYKYDMTMYVISYNFLKITSGLAGIVFST